MKNWSFSDIGKRESNEDYLISENIGPNKYLCLIADGMGGYENGKEAAKLIAENIKTLFLSLSVIREIEVQIGINKANLALRQMRLEYNQKAGATVGGILFQNSSAIIFWVGDVKVLHFKNNKLVFESKSHNLMDQVINSGAILDPFNASKYKHIVTRSIQGGEKNPEVEFHTVSNISSNDAFIIASDGIHNIISSIQVEMMLKSNPILETYNEIKNICKENSVDNASFLISKLI